LIDYARRHLVENDEKKDVGNALTPKNKDKYRIIMIKINCAYPTEQKNRIAFIRLG
jgi:hypothetical protein